MTTTRQEQFKEELFALLRKYRVEMSVRESSRGYGTVVEGISFWSPSLWSKDLDLDEPLEESFDLELGCWIDGR